MRKRISKVGKESEIGSAPTARSPTRRLGYTTVTHIQRALGQSHAGSLVSAYSLWVPMSPGDKTNEKFHLFW